MESKRIVIEQKVPGSYLESQYTMVYLDASLTVDAKNSRLKLTLFATDTFMETLTDGMQCTLVARLSRHTTTCLKTGLEKERLVKRIKLLHSLLKL
jgi:hypothetical protein